MKKFVAASGAALGSTLVGVLNSIIVVRAWGDAPASEFFQIGSLAILVGVIGEAGLGNHAVHDAAQLPPGAARQSFTNRALAVASARGLSAAIAASICARLVFGFGLPACIAAGAATAGTVVAIVGQAVLRGSGRDLLASFGGPVGATLLTGGFLAAGAVIGSIDPVFLAAAGYVSTGIATFAVLWRPVESAERHRDLLCLRRTLNMGVSNACNAAGRQFDVWIAGSLLGPAAFNDYALAAKVAASVGVLTYAAAQATAADVHQWHAGDPYAAARIRDVHGLGLTVTLALALAATATGPYVGRVVFGDSTELSRVVLAILLAGYVLTAVSGASRLLLVVAGRSGQVLRISLVGLAAALLAAFAVGPLVTGDIVASVFVFAWLAVVALLSGWATQRFVHIRSFVRPIWPMPKRLP